MSMYEAYASKVKKFANIKNTIMRFKILIISIIVVLLGLLTAYLVLKGRTFSEIKGVTSYTYGEEVDFSADPLFSNVLYFEYREQGGTEWVREAPKRKGEYSVRAVSQGSFGMSYSAEKGFTIAAAPLEFTVTDSEIEYGTYPRYTYTNLISGDKLANMTFAYENISLKSTKINVVLDSVKVVNENGDDVTSCYNVTSNGKVINFIARNISINPYLEDNVKTFVYNGEKVDYQNTFTISKELGYEDKITVETKIFDASDNEVAQAINPGEYKIKVTNYSYTSGDLNTTGNYNTTTNTYSFTINKRPITVLTSSASFVYDGLNHQASAEADYYLGEGSNELCLDHKLALNAEVAVPTVKYVADSNLDNNLGVIIVDGEGNNVTDLYQINFEYGKLDVTRRSIEVNTSSATFEYDGLEHFVNASTDVYLTEGYELGAADEFKFASENYYPKAIYPSTTSNVLDYKIVNGELDVTSNYDITNKFGDIVITKRNVKIKPKNNINFIYGDSIIYENDNYELVDSTYALNDGVDSIKVTKVKYLQNNTEITPHNVGEYGIEITDYSSDYYDVEFVSSDIKLTILKASLGINLLEVPDHLYDGKPSLYPIGNSNFEIVHGNIKYNDILEINVKYYYIDGEDHVYVDEPININIYNVIYDSYLLNGDEVDNYDISILNTSTIKIAERPLVLAPYKLDNKVLDGTALKEYDRVAYTLDQIEYQITDGEILAGEDIEIAYEFVDSNGDVVTALDAGEYTVRIKEVHVTNNGVNVDNEYAFDITSTASFEIARRKVSIKPIDRTREYGEEYNYYYVDSDPSKNELVNNATFIDINSKLLDSDEVKVIVSYDRDVKHKGTYEISITGIKVIVDGVEYAEDDYQNYEFTYTETSTLKITKRTIFLSLNDMPDYTYDGKFHQYDEESFGNYKDINRVLGYDDRIRVKVSYPECLTKYPVNAGNYSVSYGYIDVESPTDNLATPDDYDIICIWGVEYKINQLAITITLDDIENHEYDRTAYYYEEVEYGNYKSLTENLGDGDSLRLKVRYYDNNGLMDTKPINAGTYDVEGYDYEISTESTIHEALKDNYIITYAAAISYDITPRKVSIKPIDRTREYGEAYDYYYTDSDPTKTELANNNTWIDINSKLLDSDEVKVVVAYDRSVKHAGSYTISITEISIIVDGVEYSEADYNNYSFTYTEKSELVITRRNIEITLNSIPNVEYDREYHKYDELSWNNYLKADRELGYDDEIRVRVIYPDCATDYPIDVGSYKVRYSYIDVRSATDPNATSSDYSISVPADVTFTITRRTIAIKPIDRTREYGEAYDYYYVDSDPTKAALDNNDTWIDINSKLLQGDEVKVTVAYDRDVKHTGEYTISITEISIIVDGVEYNEVDYNNYLFQYTATSELKITPRIIKITLNDIDDVTYDGLYHKYDENTFSNYKSSDRALAYDDEIKVYIEYVNLTDTYYPVNAGSYTVGYNDFTVQGDSGNTVKEDYDITVDDTISFSINKLAVEITLNNMSNHEYDRQTCSYKDEYNNYLASSVALGDGDSLKAVVRYYDTNNNLMTDLPINVGTYTVEGYDFEIATTSLIHAASKDNYIITYAAAISYDITPRLVEIKPIDRTREYGEDYNYYYVDSDPSKAELSNNDTFEEVLEIGQEPKLLSGDELKVTISYDREVKHTGNYTISIIGIKIIVGGVEYNKADYQNYDITYTATSSLMITPRNIKVIISDLADVEYDREYHEYDMDSWSNYNTTSTRALAYDDEIRISVTYEKNSNPILRPIDEGTYKVNGDDYEVRGDSGATVKGDYNITYESSEFIIKRRQISIKPIDRTREYGEDYDYHHIDSDPTKAALDNNDTWIDINSKLLPGDEVKVVVAYDRDVRHVGEYVISITGIVIIVGGTEYTEAAYTNYEFTYTATSELEITKRIVEITLKDVDFEPFEYDREYHGYDETFGNYLSKDRGPSIYGEDIKVLVKYYKGTEEITPKPIDVGTYKVVGVGHEIDNGGYATDYEISFANEVEFSITPRTIEIKPIDRNREYGENYDYYHVGSDPTKATLSNNDTFEEVLGIGQDPKLLSGDQVKVVVAHAGEHKHAGDYTISITSISIIVEGVEYAEGDYANYAFTYTATSTLTITRRSMTIKLNTVANHEYDRTPHGYEYDGWSNYNKTATGKTTGIYNDEIKLEVRYIKTLTGLQITPKPIDASEYRVEIVDYDVQTFGYKSDYLLDLSDTVTYEITPREVELKPTNRETVYGATYDYLDGVNPEYVDINNKLLPGDELIITVSYDREVKRAGSYDIRISSLRVVVGGTDNYEELAYSNYHFTYTQKATLVVTPKPVTLVFKEMDDMPYNGEEHRYYNGYNNYDLVHSTPLAYDDEIEILVTYPGCQTPYPINIGEYTVRYDSLIINSPTDPNATLSDYSFTTPTDITFNIVKIHITIGLKNNVLASSYVYDSEYHEYEEVTNNYNLISGTITPGNVITVKCNYYKLVGTEYVLMDNKPINVGSYKVTFKEIYVVKAGEVEVNKENYDVTCTDELFFSITPLTLHMNYINNVVDPSYQYNGSPRYYDELAGNFELGIGDIQPANDNIIVISNYSKLVSGNYELMDGYPVDSGTYKITYKEISVESTNGNDDVTKENYNIIFIGEIGFSITPRPITIKPLDYEYEYGDEFTLVTTNFAHPEGTEIADPVEVTLNYYNLDDSPLDLTSVIHVGDYKVKIASIRIFFEDEWISEAEYINYAFSYTETSPVEVTAREIAIKLTPLDDSIYDREYHGYVENEWSNYNMEDTKTLGYDDKIMVNVQYINLYDNSVVSNKPIDAGTYKVQITSATINNLNVTDYSLDLTDEVEYQITRREVRVSPLDKSCTYGDSYDYFDGSDPTYEDVDSKLLTGDSLIITVAYDNPVKHGGTYEISIDTIKVVVGGVEYDEANYGNYSFIRDKAELVINPKAISVTLNPMNDVIYDGLAHTYDDSSYGNYASVTGLVAGDDIKVHIIFDNPTPTNVGEYHSTSCTFDSMASGESVEYGKDYTFDEVPEVTFNITQKPISVSPDKETVIYNGSVINPTAYIINSGELISGHTLTYEAVDLDGNKLEAIEAVTYDYKIKTVTISYADEIVTSNYDITLLDVSAKFRIKNRTINISSNDQEYYYDGEEHTVPLTDYSFDTTDLIEGHHLEFISGYSQTDVTSKKNVPEILIVDENNNDVTEFYKIDKTNCGTFTIKKSVRLDYEIHITDPTAITNRNVEIDESIGTFALVNVEYLTSSFELPEAWTYEYFRNLNTIIRIKRNSEGLSASIFEIGDENKGNFDYSFVIKVDIGISLLNIENVIYDGNAHLYQSGINNFTLTSGIIDTGDEIEISVNYYYLDHGAKNYVDAPVDANKYYVEFDNYTVGGSSSTKYNIEILNNPSFTISKRNITIVPDDQSVEYTGTTVNPTNYIISDGTLVSGHDVTYLACDTDGNDLNAIAIDSYTFKIKDGSVTIKAGLNDVSANYNVTVSNATATLEIITN